MSQSSFIPTTNAVRKRGRGATPRVEKVLDLNKPNRFGRRRIEYHYRPLRDWTVNEIDLAERGLRYYCQHVGGFRFVDDELMRLFIGARRGLDGEADELGVESATLIRWAIDTKAASLNGETPEESTYKKRFVGRPENFFSRDLDRWLELSPERARLAAMLAESARQERLRAEAAAHHAKSSARKRAARDDHDEADRRRRGELTAAEHELLDEWSRLPVGRQIIAMEETEQRWHEQCKQDRMDQRSDRAMDRRRIIAAAWARDAWAAKGDKVTK